MRPSSGNPAFTGWTISSSGGSNEVAFLLAKLVLEKYFRQDATGIRHRRRRCKTRSRRGCCRRCCASPSSWLAECLDLKDETFPQLLLLVELAHDAADRIYQAIVAADRGASTLKPILQPYNTVGDTSGVSFNTSRATWQTNHKCPISHVVLDSGWEGKMAQALEYLDEVYSYVKNHNLDFRIPYTFEGQEHHYLPDFIVRVDDGHGKDDLLNLIVEVSGPPLPAKAAKTATIQNLWVPAVNNSRPVRALGVRGSEGPVQRDADGSRVPASPIRRNPEGRLTMPPKKKNPDSAPDHRRGQPQAQGRHPHQHPHRGTPGLRGRGRSRAQNDALSPQSRPRSATGVEGQGRAGQRRPGGAGGAGLHPGEDSPAGDHRGRAGQRQAGPGRHAGPVRRLQRHPLYSPELIATQQEYLLALRAREQLGASEIPSVARGGANLLEAARERLRLWDISAADIAELERTRNGPPRLRSARGGQRPAGLLGPASPSSPCIPSRDSDT